MFQAQTTRIAATAVFVCLRVVTSTAWGKTDQAVLGVRAVQTVMEAIRSI